ncbi:phospholipase D-like domain-containing protein [Brevundimonas sp. Leaf168]|uniref:phospholipase D-like domain-containing protein n=1 Tax=Brevundimonas sp. Leaf168 TaxID=1736283 RepID=UPI0009E87093
MAPRSRDLRVSDRHPQLSDSARNFMGHLMVPPVLIAVMGCQPSMTAAAAADPIRVCFELDDDCIALAVQELARAQTEILVQSYAYTNRRIVQALSDAKRRGVPVRMIVDVTGERASRGRGSGGRCRCLDGLQRHAATQQGYHCRSPHPYHG